MIIDFLQIQIISNKHNEAKNRNNSIIIFMNPIIHIFNKRLLIEALILYNRLLGGFTLLEQYMDYLAINRIQILL